MNNSGKIYHSGGGYGGNASGDTISSAEGQIPFTASLPKDILEMLENGEIEKALEMLALLRQAEGEGGIATYWGKLGKQVMLAFTLPMQIILKFMEASRLLKRVAPIKNSQRSQPLHKRFADSQLLKQMLSALKTSAQIGRSITQQIINKMAQALTYSASGAMNIARFLQKQIVNAKDFTFKGMQWAAERASVLAVPLQNAWNAAYDMAASLSRHALEEMEKVSKSLKAGGKQLARITDNVFEQMQRTAVSTATVLYNIASIPVIGLFNASLQVIKKDYIGIKRAMKNLGDAGKRFMTKAQGVVEVLTHTVGVCSSYLLKYMKRLLLALWIFFIKIVKVTIQVLRVSWELAKFVTMLSRRAYFALRS